MLLNGRHKHIFFAYKLCLKHKKEREGMADTYKEIKVFSFSNMTVRVHIPDITEEERERRMKAIHKAAADLLMKERK